MPSPLAVAVAAAPTTTLVTAPDMAVLRHRRGCPAADGRLPEQADGEYRHAYGVECGIVAVGGKYDRTTGNYAPPTRGGVLRCLECGEQEIVPIDFVPAYQDHIRAVTASIAAQREIEKERNLNA